MKRLLVIAAVFVATPAAEGLQSLDDSEMRRTKDHYSGRDECGIAGCVCRKAREP
jgi:hypothetical protein